jgi:predicted CXXCH cytochrome family protein
MRSHNAWHSHRPSFLGICLATVAQVLVVPVMVAAAGHPHAEAACAGCHAWSDATVGSASATVEACRSCHPTLSRDSATLASMHRDGERDCTGCHRFHEPGIVVAGEHSLVLPANRDGFAHHCPTCHRPDADLSRLSSGHRMASTAVYHGDAARLAELSPSEACLLCHSSSGGASPEIPADDPTTDDPTTPRAPTFNEAGSHPYGIRLVTGPGRGPHRIRREADPRLTLFDGRIECQTCHDLQAGTDDLLVPFANPYDLCLGCHEATRKSAATGTVVAGTR